MGPPLHCVLQARRWYGFPAKVAYARSQDDHAAATVAFEGGAGCYEGPRSRKAAGNLIIHGGLYTYSRRLRTRPPFQQASPRRR